MQTSHAHERQTRAGSERDPALRPDSYAKPTEGTMSSIALMNLLAVLARRKALAAIQFLRKPPTGLSTTTSLQQIQHITHPDIVRRAIKICSLKAESICADGDRKLKDTDTMIMMSASSSYSTGSELAAAISTLSYSIKDTYTQETIATRMLVASVLGSEAGIWSRLKSWKEAYFRALGSITAAEGISSFKVLDSETMAKLREIYDGAKAGLDGDVH
ncbi:hypothetical protein CONPUDRAFT_78099 [Coniophora puteana RWD-64-598 SS2]|uniref:Uncharacterized protein n=1 Tax=Coniophora puteana (strain RWD-64-598) TaxID=741705 RepID=R7SE55_CONPW|nr:uncharacterized protein CONPUDRAFT_78099 [Coniophora puteana RWD-64-598 SS2]EIW74456.1 hypothetical protein CONPUDRAFT_78099 [Coniophora puteana RWD-64-598 SS2]